MIKIIPFRAMGMAAALWMAAWEPAFAQVVNRESVEAFLVEGEVKKAEKALESYVNSPDLTYPDSVYILKNLGVLYSSNPKKEKGDNCFYRLLELDPFASIHDTYASNTILARFRKIRKAYQEKKGGKALVPAVAVFDFQGAGLKPQAGATLAQQLIAEMQRLDIFHTLDRSSVVETMDKMRLTPEKCADRDCRLDIARKLTADKMVTVEVSKLDSVTAFTLAYSDVETGQVGTTLRKVASKSLDKMLAEGFGEMAAELQDKEAAWLNLSVTPTNTILTIDASPMAAISSRVPLNPGKHRICGSSPGYQSVCKDFEVKRNDALTYSLVLPLKGESAAASTRERDEPDEDQYDEEAAGNGGKPPSHAFIWWTVGSMAVLAVTLAVLFNTKD